MLKKIIIGAVIILVPSAFYVASQFGDIDSVAFDEAIETTVTKVEGDQTPKVLVVTTITSSNEDGLTGTDESGREFKIDYTGTPPEIPFVIGQRVRFVGHVHIAEEPYFHATQVYGE